MIYHGDSLEVLKTLEANSVDAVVTSPPYDSLRAYEGLPFVKFKLIAAELGRVLKVGGVIVWVVADGVVGGSETGTSFKQALFFKELGLRIHDTMIYAKNNILPLTHKRYEQGFEFMFVFSKGAPKTFNPIEDKVNKWAGTVFHGTFREATGGTKQKNGSGKKTIKPFGRRSNVWTYNNPGRSGTKHPAMFPEQLVNDHILSWSNEGDTVLDPFLGSGTTAVVAQGLNRKFIGIEIDASYVEIARTRIG